MMTEAYPLHWPQGYPRAEKRERSRFRSTFGASRDLIVAEIRRLGGTHTVISTNIPLRKDGLPYSSYSQPEDPGVAVYFMYEGSQVVLACDKWNYVHDNMHAVCKAIEALRGLNRWGVSEMMKRAFSGFKALTDGSDTVDPTFKTKSCWDVLGFPKEGLHGYRVHEKEQKIKDAFRTRAKDCHPDLFDNDPVKVKEFQELQNARDQALAEIGR